MQKWQYTTYEDGEEKTRTGLTRSEAVRAIEAAVAGRRPEFEDERQEAGTAEHALAA